MNWHMILSGIVTNLVGTAFTVLMIALVFVGRRLWLKYGPKSKPKPAIRVTFRSKYTCPHCKETAVVSPVYEESV